MAEHSSGNLDDPAPRGRRLLPRSPLSGDAFGAGAEAFARMMGTPGFLVGMTVFCAVWLTWNSLAPESAQFDPRALNFTLLTLILSLQASYAAPLLLLAQNRQDDRDRVQAEQDRQSNERNHATTDFITREIAGLRLALNDVATRDFVRGELRDLLEELEADEKAPAGRNGAVGKGARADREEAQAPALAAPDLELLRAMVREELAAALAGSGPAADAPAAGPDTTPTPTPEEPETR